MAVIETAMQGCVTWIRDHLAYEFGNQHLKLVGIALAGTLW